MLNARSIQNTNAKSLIGNVKGAEQVGSGGKKLNCDRKKDDTAINLGYDSGEKG